MFEGAHIGVLHYVFGLTVITQDHAGNAIKTLIVAAHQNLKQSGLSRKNAGYHFFVLKFALCPKRSWQGTHLISLHIRNREISHTKVTILDSFEEHENALVCLCLCLYFLRVTAVLGAMAATVERD